MANNYTTETGYITLSRRDAEVENYLDLFYLVNQQPPNHIFAISYDDDDDCKFIRAFADYFKNLLEPEVVNKVIKDTMRLDVNEIVSADYDEPLTLHSILRLIDALYPNLIVGYELSGAYWCSKPRPMEFGGFTSYDSKNIHYGSDTGQLRFNTDKANRAIESGNNDFLVSALLSETEYMVDGIKDTEFGELVKLQLGLSTLDDCTLDEYADGFKADLTVHLQSRGFEQPQIEGMMGALATTLVGPDITRPTWLLTPNVLSIHEPNNSISGWLKEITDGVNT